MTEDVRHDRQDAQPDDERTPELSDWTPRLPPLPSDGELAAHDGPAPDEARMHTVARRPRPYWRPLPGGSALARTAPVARAAPEIARVAATSALTVAGWTLNATITGAGYVARRAAAGESATAILQEAASDLRAFAWRALGLRGDLVPQPVADRPVTTATSGATTADLQRRGSDLLRRSNDVHVVEDTHPAFARILSEITPDEARILRFVYLEGPQPSLDIRTNRPLGIGSELVAAGMNMIAEHAGLRNVDRIDQYLTNLRRLGLIDFSKEQVRNPTRYQVIEAQPKVVAAMKSAGRAPKLIQRSIRLNSFGEEFVRTCLPLNGRVVPHRDPADITDGRPRPRTYRGD